MFKETKQKTLEEIDLFFPETAQRRRSPTEDIAMASHRTDVKQEIVQKD
jgi:hypothetical protein